MIYQIYYDEKSIGSINTANEALTPFGVYQARSLKRQAGHIYDDERAPNLTGHNTLCEWRVLYYIWKHYPSRWVGFTSWRHDAKGFKPGIDRINPALCASVLKHNPIAGFNIMPLKSLIPPSIAKTTGVTLKAQFGQFAIIEEMEAYRFFDVREKPLGRYHQVCYWDFVIDEYRALYGVELERDLDFISLGRIDMLHTWCNAFVATWDYFDDYMTRFSPIVMGLIEHFGSHPTDLELAYICERLIILHNYIKYTNGEFRTVSSDVRRKSTGSMIEVMEGPPGPCEFSIITCSVDDKKFDQFEKNVKASFGHHAQVIRIKNTASITAGYNQGVRQAIGEILIFCHDDIEFLNADVAELIRVDLQASDIVGVAGTSMLNDGNWISMGQPFTHGQVIHERTEDGPGYVLCVYGLGRDDTIVNGIQALDGLFFAVKRSVTDALRFDEELFDGFHLYDLDFTYAAFLKGARIMVDHRIHLLHRSKGNFDRQWARYAYRFSRKYAKTLPANKLGNCSKIIKGVASASKDRLVQEMQHHVASKRTNILTIDDNQPGAVEPRITPEGMQDVVISGKNQAFPFANDSIDYMDFQFRSSCESDWNYCLAEILRVSRHGAVVQCIQPEMDRALALRANVSDSNNQNPQRERLSRNNAARGKLILMGAMKDKVGMATTYYQVNKVLSE